MKTDQYELGMVGLGVMGRNLVFNIAEHGFSVIGLDKDPQKVTSLIEEGRNLPVYATGDLKEFIRSLKRPKAIMMLVPAGAPVDAVIAELRGVLEPDDILIDGGNSYFKDTDVRGRDLAKQGIRFLGIGVSGGEEGARHGPSFMPGGPKAAYERVRPIFEAAAAQVNKEPCVTWLGPDSAGHYVKMVHNGIEYGLMQLIAESYDLMKRGLGLSETELHAIYTAWNQGELNGYLMEITGHIFAKHDKQTGKWLIDEILDVARQKGTGMWTAQSAMELQVPIPTIDQAVSMRDMSTFQEERNKAEKIYQKPISQLKVDRKAFIEQLKQALYVSMILTYTQGFALLVVASKKYSYGINFSALPRIWRGGCIIRSALLDDISDAFKKNSQLPNLLLDNSFAEKVRKGQEDLRAVITQAVNAGVPMAAFMASLAYFDAYRSAWLPTNLIQAQRDYFGAHTYERVDAKGSFHMEWEKE